MFTKLLLCVRCGIKNFTYIIACDSHNYPEREIFYYTHLKMRTLQSRERLKYLFNVTNIY